MPDYGSKYKFITGSRDIVTKLNGEILRAASHPDFKAVLARAAIEPIGSTPEELAKFMKSEITKWAKVVQDANVQVD